MSADDARQRFYDATRRHLLAPLPGGIEVRAATPDEWSHHTDAWWNAEARGPIDLGPAYSDEMRAGLADLDACLAPGLRHHVVLWNGDEPIGSYHGEQEPWGRYYMVNTILAPAWRSRGLYRAMLGNVERAVAAAGFREMYSRHRADNNAVIVPKLKAGWLISAFEVTLKYGLLVHLKKYLVDELVRLHGYRVDGGDAPALRAAGLRVP